MHIERRKKKLDVRRITSDVADYCGSIRRSDEPRDRIFRRGKNEQVHASKDTMLRVSAPVPGAVKNISRK